MIRLILQELSQRRGAGCPDNVHSRSPVEARRGISLQRHGQKTEPVRVIDWQQPANNDFLLVSQFSVTSALYTCRPDLVGFVTRVGKTSA